MHTEIVDNIRFDLVLVCCCYCYHYHSSHDDCSQSLFSRSVALTFLCLWKHCRLAVMDSIHTGICLWLTSDIPVIHQLWKKLKEGHDAWRRLFNWSCQLIIYPQVRNILYTESIYVQTKMITTTNDFLNNQTSSFRWSINARFNSTSPNSSDVNLNHSVQPIDITSSALGIFLSLFCFITVFGNGLVIYAIVQERYLKSGESRFNLTMTSVSSDSKWFSNVSV